MSSNASQCVALLKARLSKITSSLSRKEIFGFKISVGFILAKFRNDFGAIGRDFEEMILKYLGRKVQKVPKLGPKLGRQPLWLMISNPFRWNRLKMGKSYLKVFKQCQQLYPKKLRSLSIFEIPKQPKDLKPLDRDTLRP